MLQIGLAILWAMLVTLFAIPSIIYVAHSKQLLDRPNHRTVHQELTPRLGGIAIFAGFMSAVTIFGAINDSIQYILAGCLIIFFLGTKDDIVTLSAFKKFFGQVLAASIVIFMGNIRITSFYGFLGIGELNIIFSYVFTLFVIIGVTNALNLIDGLDGLAGTIVTVICTSFGIYFFMTGMPYAFLCFAMVGAIAGFLRFNFYKAKIFMGDAGSLLCGFVVSTLAIKFIASNILPTGPALAMAVLIIPITDTIRVFTARILNGHSPFRPDKRHLHHRLLAAGLPQLGVVGFLAGLNLLVISLTVLLGFLGNTTIILLMVSVMLIFNFLLEAMVKRRLTDGQA